MRGLVYAVQFLTIVPAGKRHPGARDVADSMMYFPIVGLLLGAALGAIANILAYLNFDDIAASATTVFLLIILTRGLHLDGLADTMDGILSGKDKEDVLKIMRDPHIGALGVLALISVIGLKVALLSSISLPHKTASLVLMCVLGRWSMIYSIYRFPYARPDGKAAAFAKGINTKILIITTLAAILLTVFFGGLAGPVSMAMAVFAVYVIGRIVFAKIGGMTGDTIGAVCEMSEVAVLFAVCILEGLNLWPA